MIRDQWTVLFHREDASKMGQFSLPTRLVRRAFVAVCALALFLIGATAFLVVDTGTRVRAAHLARENRLLQGDLEEVRASLDQLDRKMATLAEKDRRVRLVAGLLEIDEEVFDVGVGGPGLDPEASEMAYAVHYDLAVLLRQADLLGESYTETEDSLTAKLERLRFTPLILPTRGPVSSGFSASRFHPVHRVYMPHEGIDLNAATGTRFVATADGVVKFAGWKAGFGNTVEIDHRFGVSTLYGHASKLLVRAGDRVRRGDVIGQVGCTGVCTGPHVHYEVHVNGRPVNPINYVLRSTSQ